ncbi:MAG: DUF4810 domain-containing protein [bacterium]
MRLFALCCHSITILSFLLVSGCATEPAPYYYWGSYENLIYKQYTSPGEIDHLTQIQLLENDIKIAETSGQPIPPGVFAHLGVLYAIQGNISESFDAFEQEKERFPEASTFLDGMMERALKDQERESQT